MATRAEKIHQMLAAHHTFAQAEHHKAMEGKTGKDRDYHANMTEHHAAQAEAHVQEMEDCQKAERDQLTKQDRLQPTQVSAVAPERPVRAVPRHGHPAHGTPNVEPVFQKLVAVEDGMEETHL